VYPESSRGAKGKGDSLPWKKRRSLAFWYGGKTTAVTMREQFHSHALHLRDNLRKEGERGIKEPLTCLRKDGSVDSHSGEGGLLFTTEKRRLWEGKDWLRLPKEASHRRSILAKGSGEKKKEINARENRFQEDALQPFQ